MKFKTCCKSKSETNKMYYIKAKQFGCAKLTTRSSVSKCTLRYGKWLFEKELKTSYGYFTEKIRVPYFIKLHNMTPNKGNISESMGNKWKVIK